MKHFLAGVVLLVVISTSVRADEGMWLPIFLRELNAPQMKKLGMKISAEDIYSINKGSMKDAVVSFGGGCTGGVVSNQGLLLTNHHCGRGRIQALSTPESNYLKDGFWAMNLSQELPSEGLSVTFIVRIDDVSKAVLDGVAKSMSEKERQSAIDKNLEAVRNQAARESWQNVFVRAFYEGNQYFLFVTETFNDIRLVGAPPESIGNFGVDTDNWMWPRHTGDFSVFRIYADKNNRPAEYAPDNVPYRPRYVLPVSMGGIREGDFSLTFGFPGRTNLYLPAAGVEMQVDVLNPIRVGIRDQILAIMGEAMRADQDVKLQYASKQAGIANAWKKWIGETQGLKRVGGLEQKRRLEAEFTRRVNANPPWKAAYGSLLSDMEKVYADLMPLAVSRDYFNETTRQVELFRLASFVDQALRLQETQGAEAAKKRSAQIIGGMKNYYKNYQASIDRQLFERLLGIYFEKIPQAAQPGYAVELLQAHGGSVARLAETIFANTQFTDPQKGAVLLESNWEAGLETLRDDPALKLYREINAAGAEYILKPASILQEQLPSLHRSYMQALTEVFPEKRFAPDANSTMRVSYGQVSGYRPRDAVRYEAVSWLDGVMEKYKPGDYEFDVPEKLRALYAAKDFGPYGENGRMPVCYITTSHSTGGNSGSPTFDANGNLAGLLFDGSWEGVISDYYFSEEINRSIIVDIRYILFVIDKFGGAKHLVDEMTLVSSTPKGKK